jgi:hypothetical protein
MALAGQRGSTGAKPPGQLSPRACADTVIWLATNRLNEFIMNLMIFMMAASYESKHKKYLAMNVRTFVFQFF